MDAEVFLNMGRMYCGQMRLKLNFVINENSVSDRNQIVIIKYNHSEAE